MKVNGRPCISDFGIALSIRHTNMHKLKPFGIKDYLAKEILDIGNSSIGKTAKQI